MHAGRSSPRPFFKKPLAVACRLLLQFPVRWIPVSSLGSSLRKIFSKTGQWFRRKAQLGPTGEEATCRQCNPHKVTPMLLEVLTHSCIRIHHYSDASLIQATVRRLEARHKSETRDMSLMMTVLLALLLLAVTCIMSMLGEANKAQTSLRRQVKDDHLIHHKTQLQCRISSHIPSYHT